MRTILLNEVTLVPFIQSFVEQIMIRATYRDMVPKDKEGLSGTGPRPISRMSGVPDKLAYIFQVIYYIPDRCQNSVNSQCFGELGQEFDRCHTVLKPEFGGRFRAIKHGYGE